MSHPSLSEIYDAFAEALSDLDSWQSCGPEGYTPEELARRESYDDVLDRLALAMKDELAVKNDRVARFLAL